jgi:hypothetical protein
MIEVHRGDKNEIDLRKNPGRTLGFREIRSCNCGPNAEVHFVNSQKCTFFDPRLGSNWCKLLKPQIAITALH